ncbi:IS66 family insertion sequence element accessory protein TnpA [Butyrivibrio sp. TB]|uniref:IS66 family insertion sequence element accessory protein TnpA n=1 Tax=Butyrivibrio sp. TB TaxID=1520809 RepID=UPI0008BC5839|nr:hypothetical protein [Butyrivibrio sp. TB]SEP94720.1 hypothetical protein SAMN02910382_01501 [Butyrivibrio sp. TB]
MNAKQKIYQATMTKWAALIKDQKDSGLTIRQWCDQKNVSFHAYNYWKHILKKSVVDSVMPDIVLISQPLVQSSNCEMILPESGESHNSRILPDTTTPVSISLGDVHIEIGASASDDVIANIIKAVRHT